MLHANLSVNEKGHLVIAGFDAADLVEKYGSPLYVVDEQMIRANCRAYVDSMREYLGEDSMPLYASKAMSFKQMYRIVHEEGMGVDVVSSGELYTALQAGFPAEKIYFHGSNKTDEDISYGIGSGIAGFVIDSREEMYRIDEIAGEAGVKQNVMIRLTPGIDPHTFEAVNTGKVDSKFGIAIETGQAAEFVAEALQLKNIVVKGFHCHIGSQVFDIQPFTDSADIMLAFMAQMKREHNFDTEVLNLGGGLGVRYVESDPVIDYAECVKGIAAYVKNKCAEMNVPLPKILLEPGRSIVANAAVTLYTVGSMKTITGYKSYVSIDGGMTDNPRYALYGSEYTIHAATKMNEPCDQICTVAGRCCESGDLIQEDVALPKLERGDLVAVLVTGAYNFSMASNYNRVRRLPVIMLNDGNDYVAVRRETFEDIVERDI